MDELRWILTLGGDEEVVKADSVPAANQSRLAWGLALAFGLLALSLVVWSFTGRDLPPQITRTSVTLPQHAQLDLGGVPTLGLAISADGRSVVHVGGETRADSRLYLRSMEELTLEPLTGTDKATQPFFSPDGKWIAFFTLEGELKKLSLEGGDPVTLLEGIGNAQLGFGSWGNDDTIIFSAIGNIQRVSAGGGMPESLTTIDPQQGEFHFNPTIVPNTGDILFTLIGADLSTNIELLRSDTGERLTVLENAVLFEITATGHLLFSRNDVLMAVEFDEGQHRIVGQALPLPDAVAKEMPTGLVRQMAVSRTGTLVYKPARPASVEPKVGWVSRTGEFDLLGQLPQEAKTVRMSPDGERALVKVGLVTSQIYLFELARGIPTLLNTSEPRVDQPIWHPNGQLTLGGSHLSLLDIDRRTVVPLTSDELLQRPGSWSPDGAWLAYVTSAPQFDIHVLPVRDGGEPFAFADSGFEEYTPTFSPDGQWIAYGSTESDTPEIYVARFPDGGSKIQVSNGGGWEPIWRPDGRELFFKNAAGELAAIAIEEGDPIRLGEYRPLFPLVDRMTNERYSTARNPGPAYDVSHDGERFLMIRLPVSDPETEIVVVQNWFEELTRLVPTGN